jgi:hypothetical protein
MNLVVSCNSLHGLLVCSRQKDGDFHSGAMLRRIQNHSNLVLIENRGEVGDGREKRQGDDALRCPIFS